MFLNIFVNTQLTIPALYNMDWKIGIRDFLIYLKLEKGLSENTVISYERDILKLSKFCLNMDITNPIKVESSTISEFIFQIAKIGYNPKSQARLLSGIRGFYNFLLLEDYISINPSDLIEAPKIQRNLPEILSIEEIDALLNEIDRSTKEGERNRVIIETLYGCGLRASELINLNISDVFIAESVIKVKGKGDKQRFIPLANNTMNILKFFINEIRPEFPFISGEEDTMFVNRRGKKLTRVMIFTIIKQLIEKSGIKKKVSPHTFRHSYATHLLEGGADLLDIQQLLGHASIATTEIYLHTNQGKLKDAINKYHPRNNKNDL
jgi:integrase/recombinase XerD